MDDFSVAPRTFAGDPFGAAKVAAEEKLLTELEERQELRDEIKRLRHRLRHHADAS